MSAPSPWPLAPRAAVVITPVPEVNVSAILSPVRGAAKVSALFAVLDPPDVLMVVASVSTMLELDVPMVVGPLLVMVPAKFTVLGAVAVKPAPKVIALDDRLPNVRLPVFKKAAALVMVLELPIILTLYGLAVVTNEPALSPPSKETVAAEAVFEIVTAFAEFTAPENVAPPESATVRKLRDPVDPILALELIAAAPEFNVKPAFEETAEENPETAQDSSLLA